MTHNIEEAKRLLPLPGLMIKIGDATHAKKSARCPFPDHEDKTNSFSVFRGNGGEWFWKCHAGCGSGDEVSYLEKRFVLSPRDAIARYCVEAGLNGAPKASPKAKADFNWAGCVAALSAEAKRDLANWRGLSPEFVERLHRERAIGSYAGCFAFPVRNAQGQTVSCHYLADRAKRKWNYFPKGRGTHPLTFGDVARAAYVLCFESQWDAFAAVDRLGWHVDAPGDSAAFITRGAENGKLIAGQCSPDALVYAFVQNDPPDIKGRVPAENWLATLAARAGCKVLRVTTPAPHKDANDWTRAGGTKAEIEIAIRNAKLVEPAQRETVAPLPKPEAAADFANITAWVRGQILFRLQDTKELPSVKNTLIASDVAEALARFGRFYFHADLRDFDSAMFFDGHRKRLERVRANAFAAWLSEWLAINRAGGLFKYILAAIETTALSGAHTTGILPESYWAARPGALYLSSGDGAVVKITGAGVALADNGADGVLFSAGRTLAPWKLTEPRDPFETCSLFRNAHSSAAHGRTLLQLWFYSFTTMPRSKPPLGAIGEIGSGKTRTLKGVAEFYGIPFRAAKVEEQLEPNFWPNVNEGGLFVLDNADSKCRWLADAVAAAATDGCSQRRKLYTNSDTVTLRANAWLAITSANPTFGNDAGLADRVLLVRMERTGEDTSDAALTDEILAARDAGLSHIAETLREALADTAPTPVGLNARHPDFAAFAVRIGRALGREADAVAALQAAEADKSAFCLENDIVAAALLAYLREARSFTGTAAELAPKLVEIDSDLKDRLSAKRLGKRLAALWPHLQKALATARRETGHGGAVTYTVRVSNGDYGDFQMDFSQNHPRVCA